MSNVQTPLVQSYEDELTLRRNYRGPYHVKYKCPYTDEKLDEVRYTRFEYPSPVPVEIPISLRAPESTDDKIRRLMNEQREWIAWQEREEETEDDEHDFDDENFDPDVPPSPFEFVAEASKNIRRQSRLRAYKEWRGRKAKEAENSDAELIDDKPPTPPKEESKQPPPKAPKAKTEPNGEDK